MGSSDIAGILLLAREKRTNADPAFKAMLHRLLTELQRRAIKGGADASSFHLSAYSALKEIKGFAHADVRMQALYDCSQFFHQNGLLALAIECVEELRRIARGTKNLAWTQRAESVFGVTYAECGQIAQAIEHYAAALAVPKHEQWAYLSSTVFVNLGVALNYGSLYRDAIPCFYRAIALNEEGRSDEHLHAAALCNIAQSHLFLEEYESGFQAICKSLSYCPPRPDLRTVAALNIREYTFVLLAIELGDFRSAREHAALCRSHADTLNTSRARFQSDIALGLIDVYAGDVDAGLNRIERALDSSITEISMYRAVALAALVKAYERASRPEAALRRLQELMMYVRTVRNDGLTALRLSNKKPATGSDNESRDLAAYDLRAARLRALVAEKERDNSSFEFLERLAITTDLREDASGQHGFRVGALSRVLAIDLQWSEGEADVLERAARLHDIGKLAVPDRILFSSDLLKEAQRNLIATHSVIGAELLSSSQISEVQLGEAIARHHHEWWNGEGYPSRLRGKRIPIEARIVALADVFDALTHGRPFSPPWPVEKALAEIRSRRGTQFDPELTDLFLVLMERLLNEHEDLDAYLGQASRHSPFLQARNRIRKMLEDERENEKLATVGGNTTRH